MPWRASTHQRNSSPASSRSRSSSRKSIGLALYAVSSAAFIVVVLTRLRAARGADDVDVGDRVGRPAGADVRLRAHQMHVGEPPERAVAMTREGVRDRRASGPAMLQERRDRAGWCTRSRRTSAPARPCSPSACPGKKIAVSPFGCRQSCLEGVVVAAVSSRGRTSAADAASAACADTDGRRRACGRASGRRSAARRSPSSSTGAGCCRTGRRRRRR